MLALVVTNDFADYKRGDQITDPAVIAEIREAGQEANVVPIQAPDPEPAARHAAACQETRLARTRVIVPPRSPPLPAGPSPPCQEEMRGESRPRAKGSLWRARSRSPKISPRP